MEEIAETKEVKEKQVEKPVKPKPKPQPPKETPIGDKLEPAIVTALKRANVVTVEQLKALSIVEILQIKGIDATRLERILRAIKP